MHRWAIGLCLFFLAPGLSVHAEDSTQETIDKILAPQGAKFDLSLITPQNRDQIIDRLRDLADTENYGLSCTILLLQLGDQRTVDKIIERYHNLNSRDALEEVPFIIQRAKQPLLIPPLAADLYLPEDQLRPPPPTAGQDVIFSLSRPASSADLILETIITSPVFSVELKSWAKQSQRSRFGDSKVFINTVKQWWEQNEDRLKKGDYKNVRKPLL